MIEEMITGNLENEFIFYFFSDRKYCKKAKILTIFLLLEKIMSLKELRKRLSNLDKKLLNTIAERQQILSQIGLEKRNNSLPPRDYEREKIVLDMAREYAKSKGISSNLAEDIFTLLIHSSLTHQEQERVVAEGKGDGRKALVIGGEGKMGKWFVNFFRSQGFITYIADPRSKTADSNFYTFEEAGIDYDVIVVATPIAESKKILTELASKKPAGLVFDIGSLKTPLRRGLKALLDVGCNVTSIHPMFGPDTELLSGKHIIFIDVGNKKAIRQAKELFAATMAEKLDMNIDDHDRLIAYVLGLSHALNIAFFTALAESGEAAPKLAKLSSTTFDAQLLVSSTVANDSPYLYFEIQNLNEYGLDPLNALCHSVERIQKIVDQGNETEFVKLMKRGREYLSNR